MQGNKIKHPLRIESGIITIIVINIYKSIGLDISDKDGSTSGIISEILKDLGKKVNQIFINFYF